MKKIAVSVGIVALGAVVAQAAPYSINSMQASKAWSIGASLRGFYDDNYALASSNEQDTFGFVVSPTIGVNLPLDQTLITADYVYSLYYFDDRADNQIDQTHEFVLSVLHSFSERFAIELKDSFVVAQEPQVIDNTNPGGSRARGTAIRNTASVRLNGEITRQLGFVLGYENTYVNYDNDNGSAGSPSLSGLLDRISHTANIDLRWLVARNTTALVGYQLEIVDYTADEVIAAGPFMSDDRNSVSHFIYAGVDHSFNQALNATLKGGVQFTDYPNDPYDRDEVGPYVEGNLSYTYAAAGSVQFGVRHARNSTDQISPDVTTGHPTLDQESTTVFANVKHQFTSRIAGTLFGMAQFSTINGGSADGNTDSYYGAGLDLSYAFNQHFSTDIGYNFDMLDSDTSGRDYTRNRIFLGFSATY